MTRCAHVHTHTHTHIYTHVSNTYRLFGLTPIIQTDCDRPTELLVRSGVIWTEILSPILILGLFWLLSTDLRMWLSTPVSLSYSQLETLAQLFTHTLQLESTQEAFCLRIALWFMGSMHALRCALSLVSLVFEEVFFGGSASLHHYTFTFGKVLFL